MKKVRLFLLLALALISLRASAQSYPRIGISTFSAKEISPTDKLSLIKKVSDDFQVSTRVPVTRDSQLQGELNEAANQETQANNSLEEAKQKLAAGKKAYLNLDFEQARGFLENARKLFILNLHKLDDNQAMLQSHLYLGMVYVALDSDKTDSKRAVEEFRKVAFLDPDLELSTKDYSPEIVATFSKAKNQINREVLGAVLVESTPDKAKFYINGHATGVTPLNLNLPVGEYFFRLSKPGHRDWYQLQKIEEGFQKVSKNLSENVSAEEEKSELFRTVSKEYPATTRLVEQLSEKAISMQVDVLLLGELVHQKEFICKAQWFDARTQEFSPAIAIKGRNDLKSLLDRTPLLVKGLLELVSANGYILSDKSLTPKLSVGTSNAVGQSLNPNLQSPSAATAGNAEEELLWKRQSGEAIRPWYKKWWVWGIIGGTAAAVTTGVIISNSAGSSSIIVDNGGNVATPSATP